MSESYYDSQIKKEQENVNIYSRLVDVAMGYLNPKNTHRQNSLSGAWMKVKYAKDAKERNGKLKTFLGVLNAEKAFTSKVISSSLVSKSLRERFRNVNGELEYSNYSLYASDISIDAKKSVEKYARSYVMSCNAIESLNRQKETEAKKVQEREQEGRKHSTDATSNYYERTNDDLTETSVIATVAKSDESNSKNVKVGGVVIFHEYDSFETREKKAIEYLENKIVLTRARGYGKFFLTSEELKMLNKVFSDGRSLQFGTLLESGRALQDTLYRLQQYEHNAKIPFKESNYNPNLGDVLLAASSVYSFLPDELLTPFSNTDNESKFENKLRTMSGMSKGLETYEKIYSIYLNYFNGLPDLEKENIKSTFMTEGAFAYYKKQFNITSFEIINPSKLKILVNSKIKDKMVNSFTMYMDTYHYNDLIRVTTYMSIEEVAGLYMAIKALFNKYSSIDYTRNVDNQMAYYEDATRELLKNFVNVILFKMNLGNLSLEERNKKIDYIMKEILHENVSLEIYEPQNDSIKVEDKKVEDKTVKSEDGTYHYVAGGKREKTTNRAIAARYNAQNRFFGMNRVQQTMAKMSGKWREFEKLWNKVALSSSEEQEEIADKLDLMFRR